MLSSPAHGRSDEESTMAPQPETGRAGGAPPRWLLPALVAALLVAAAALAVALTTRTPTAAQPPAAPAAQAPAAQAPADSAAEVPDAHGGLNPDGPPVEQIGLADARARFDAGSAVFIDVRSGGEYAAGHIPGALTITSSELEQRLAQLPADAAIIAYGDAARPESGPRGAQIFMELGYPKVIALEGGFQGWQAAGHPVESSLGTGG
jgi:rhodanese-related sulfurtransferase